MPKQSSANLTDLIIIIIIIINDLEHISRDIKSVSKHHGQMMYIWSLATKPEGKRLLKRPRICGKGSTRDMCCGLHEDGVACSAGRVDQPSCSHEGPLCGVSVCLKASATVCPAPGSERCSGQLSVGSLLPITHPSPAAITNPDYTVFYLAPGGKEGVALGDLSTPPLCSLIALESRTAAVLVYQCSLPSVCKHASPPERRAPGGTSPRVLIFVVILCTFQTSAASKRGLLTSESVHHP
jgi:hypothetical protein